MAQHCAAMDADPRNMSRHARDAWPELDALFAAGDAVADLVEHPGWACVLRVLQLDVAEIDRKLDQGRDPLTQAEYALRHGRRGGLMAAQEAAHAIVSHAERVRAEQQAEHERTAEPVQGRQ